MARTVEEIDAAIETAQDQMEALQAERDTVLGAKLAETLPADWEAQVAASVRSALGKADGGRGRAELELTPTLSIYIHVQHYEYEEDGFDANAEAA